MNSNLTENELSKLAIGAAMKVHSKFGPGLLESAYRQCLAYELKKAGLTVEMEKPVPLVYEDIQLEHGYRLDILVNNCLVIETKAVDEIADVHISQVLTYLKVGDYKLGLLLNFRQRHMKDGIRRVVNSL
jgi:GxxExxY protein